MHPESGVRAVRSVPSIATLRFWRAYLVTARPYLCFVSGAAGLVGLSAGAPPSASALRIALGFLPCFVAYGLGQALTDVYQTDTDAISAPYRPLVRGEIGGREILAVSLGGLALCGLLLAALCPWNLVLACLGVAGLLAYTPLKRRWWAGPAWNAWIVALVAGMGLLSAQPSLLEAARSPRLAPLVVSVFFSYAVFVLLGYLKDVEADRATGYQTLPVRFGRRATVAASALSALAATLASALLLRGSQPLATPRAALAAVLWLAGLTSLALAHARALRVERDAEAHPAIACSARGFVLLHAGTAALLRGSLLELALALAVAFELALQRRPERSQL